MRRIGFGTLVLATLLAHACASKAPADPQPTVTARGTAGDEDVPDLTIRQVTLKAGETLLVSCRDEGGDAGVYWKDIPLHLDVGTQGSGFYTTIFSLYSATGGTGDIVAAHVTGGDLTINAYSVTGLAPSALDKTAAAQGTGATPSSGATAITSRAGEFLWGAIGYGSNGRATGTWSAGFTPGTQFTSAGGIGGVDDGYKTVSSTGAYAAAKTGVDKDAWAAVIATYATTAWRDPIR
jgi:hypothetical protein